MANILTFGCEGLHALIDASTHTAAHIESVNHLPDVFASSCPDVILVDLDTFPLQDCLELCRRARLSPLLNSINIIAISDGKDESKLFAAFDAGANEFLIKPVNKQELATKLALATRGLQIGAIAQAAVNPLLKGKYKIKSILRSECSNVVYSASASDGDGQNFDVAIKITRNTDADASFKLRALRGAQILASLKHPNIAEIIEHNCDDHASVVVTRLIHGLPLKRMIEIKPLHENEATALALELHPALELLRANNVIHRDIKPDNIIVDLSGSPILIDFGLARHVEQITVGLKEFIHGTPHFVSPEYIKGRRELDYKTDVYSLGVTFFHAVTGLLPFEGSNPMTIFHKHFKETPPYLSEMNCEISEDFSEIIDLMLVKNPKARLDLDSFKRMLSELWSKYDAIPQRPPRDLLREALFSRMRADHGNNNWQTQ